MKKNFLKHLFSKIPKHKAGSYPQKPPRLKYSTKAPNALGHDRSTRLKSSNEEIIK